MPSTAKILKKMAIDMVTKEIQDLFDRGRTWDQIAANGYSKTTISNAVKGRARPRKRDVVTKN